MLDRRTFLAAAVSLSAVGPARAGDKLSVAVNRFSSGAPLFLASALGFFKEQDLDVTFAHANSAQTLGLAVGAGDASIGLTALTAGIFTLAHRGAIKLVTGGWEERPRFRQNAVVVGSAAFTRGVTKIADLAGLKIGATQAGSPQENQWVRAARKHGFRYDQLRMTPLQTLPNVVSALQGGQVDAAALPATLARQLERAGHGHIIAWMGDEVPGLFGAICANAAALERNPALLVRFLRAYLRAIAYYDAAVQRRGPNGEVMRGENFQNVVQVVAEYLNEPAGQVAESLPYFNPAAPLVPADINEQIEAWKSLRFVSQDTTAQSVIDERLVKMLTVTNRT